MTPPELRPVILVRQIRLCGFGVVIGLVAALIGRPWLGIAAVVACLALMVLAIIRFQRS